MKDCLFCKITKKEIPADIVYEDEDIMAFLDIAPANKGHTLVVPKKHSTNIFDIDEDTLNKVNKAAKKLAIAIKNALGAEGVNISSNNGIKQGAAGQIIMHSHIHIIPRFKDDGLKPWPNKRYKEGESKEIAEKIIDSLD